MGDAQRIDAGQIAGYLAAIVPLLDVDGDSNISASTDGALLMRYLLGQRNQALVTALVGGGATRPSSSAIEAYLAMLLP